MSGKRLVRRKTELINQLRGFLKPELVTDDRAKLGTVWMNGLEDKPILYLFAELCVKKRQVEDLIPYLLKQAEQEATEPAQESCKWALRRFRLITQHIAKSLIEKQEAQKESTELAIDKAAGKDVAVKEAELKGLPTTFGKDNAFEDVWFDIQKKSENADPIEELGFLVELQKRRVQKLLMDSQGLNLAVATSTAKVLDKAIETLYKLTDNYARLLIETGKIARAPLRVESFSRMQQSVEVLHQVMPAGTQKDKALQATVRLVEMLQNGEGVFEPKALPSGNE